MSEQRQILTDTFWITAEALNEARGQKRIESIGNGRYRINRVRGQHCYLGEGKGLQKNRNGRRYPAETTWGRHTSEDADFMRKVRQRRVIGQLEHPSDGKSSMGLGAIVITDVSPPDPQTGEVFISFESMSTPAGKIVSAYVEDGVGFGLSSRGSGSVVNKGGVDEVQPDFEPYTFDCVIDESTPGAEVASSKLKEARHALVEAAGGDLKRAAELAIEQTEIALARCGPDGCCESVAEGNVDSRRLIGKTDGAAVIREISRYGRIDYVRNGNGVKLQPQDWADMDAWALGGPPDPDGFAVINVFYTDGRSVWVQAREGRVRQVGVGPSVGESRTEETMGSVETGGPVGHSEYLCAIPDGSGHYRAYDNGSALWDVWLHVHNLPPKKIASALQTLRDAKAAAESHLHNVVGEASSAGVESTEADATKTEDPEDASVKEAFSLTSSLPYMGTMLKMTFDSESEAKSATNALEKAGFYSRLAADKEVSVYTQIEDADQALEHVSRILSDKGIETREESVAIGAIHGGEIVWVDEEFSEEAAPIQETGMAREIVFDFEDFDLNEMGGPSAAGMPRVQGARKHHGAAGPHEMMPSGNPGAQHDIAGPHEMGDIEPEDDDPGGDDGYADIEPSEMDDAPHYYGEEDDDEEDDYADEPDDDEEDEGYGENIGSPPTIDDPEDLDLDLEIDDEDPEGDWDGGGYNESAGKAYYRTFPWRVAGKQRGSVRLWFDKEDKLVEVRGYDRKGRLLVKRTTAKRPVGESKSKKARTKQQPSLDERRAVRAIINGIISEAGSYSDAGPSMPTAQVKRKGGKGGPGHGAKRKKSMAKTVGANESQVQFLQNEVARLESENNQLRELLDASAAVQQAEAIEAAVEAIVGKHPNLKPLKNRLTRFDTVDEVTQEAESLLAILGESNTGDTGEAAGTPESGQEPEQTSESLVRVVKGRGANGATSSAESTQTEGAPRGPLEEDAVPAAPLSESKKRDVGNTAGRVAAAMRRRRARRRDR